MTGCRARGADHIGITVPDVDEATRFFTRALGAIHLYDLIRDYALVSVSGREPSGRTLRFLGLGGGPAIELFEYEGARQQRAAMASDLGFQHVAVYVDDIAAAAAVAEGGELLAGPNDLPGIEPGGRFHYARTPWGSLIELITYPQTQTYSEATDVRRWMPQPLDG